MNEKDLPHLMASALGDEPPPMALPPVLAAGRRTRRRAFATRYAGGGVLAAGLTAVVVAVSGGMLSAGQTPLVGGGGPTTPTRVAIPPAQLCPENAKNHPTPPVRPAAGAFPTVDAVRMAIREYAAEVGLDMSGTDETGGYSANDPRSGHARLALTYTDPNGRALLGVEIVHTTGALAMVYAEYLRANPMYPTCDEPRLRPQPDGSVAIHYPAPVGRPEDSTQHAQHVSPDGLQVIVFGCTPTLSPDQTTELAIRIGSLPR